MATLPLSQMTSHALCHSCKLNKVLALSPKYLGRRPQDPWGNDYLYLNPGEHSDNNAFDLFSYGSDGKPDGEGMNADIGNWSLEETNEE